MENILLITTTRDWSFLSELNKVIFFYTHERLCEDNYTLPTSVNLIDSIDAFNLAEKNLLPSNTIIISDEKHLLKNHYKFISELKSEVEIVEAIDEIDIDKKNDFMWSFFNRCKS